jgi:hypothetical protein
MRHRAREEAMTHKIPGCCSLCDEPCFEIMARWDEGEKRAGEPKRLGAPNPDAVRVSFQLFDGSIGDFTFCGSCAAKLNPAHYALLWQRNLAGYLREQNGVTDKFIEQFNNGILCEVTRELRKDLQ